MGRPFPEANRSVGLTQLLKDRGILVLTHIAFAI
jgi:hypothetical protein